MHQPIDPKTFRPPYLQDKFWDDETGEARVESLAKSYNALERRFGAGACPDCAEGYNIVIRSDDMDLDPEVNERLFKAGFTHEQAQLVYDLANERLRRIVEYARGETARQGDIERLKHHFGADGWEQRARQIETWGQANLPREAYQALCCSYDGVMALDRMMGEPIEPGLGRSVPARAELTEEQLVEMMDDPRYWRDHDKDWIEKVQSGFKRLYPGKA